MERAYAYMNARDTAGTEAGDAFIRATQQIYGRDNARFAVDAIQARIDRADAMANRPTGVGGGGSKGGSGGGAVTNALLSVLPIDKLQMATVGTTTSMKELQARLNAYNAQLSTATSLLREDAATQVGLSTTGSHGCCSLTAALKMGGASKTPHPKSNQTEMAKNIQPVQIPAELKVDGSPSTTAKDTAEGWKSAADAINQVGGALAGLEDPAAKVMGIVAQAIATIALTFANHSKAHSPRGGIGLQPLPRVPQR